MIILERQQQHKQQAAHPTDLLQRLRKSKLLERLQQSNRSTKGCNQQQARNLSNDYLSCLASIAKNTEQLMRLPAEDRRFCARFVVQCVCFFLQYCRETGKQLVETTALLKNSQLVLFNIDKTMFLRFAHQYLKAIAKEFELESRLFMALMSLPTQPQSEEGFTAEEFTLGWNVSCPKLRRLAYKFLMNVLNALPSLENRLKLASHYLHNSTEQVLEQQPNILVVHIHNIESLEDIKRRHTLYQQLTWWLLPHHRKHSDADRCMMICFRRVTGQEVCARRTIQSSAGLSIFYELRKHDKLKNQTAILTNLLLSSLDSDRYTQTKDILEEWLGMSFDNIDIRTLARTHEKGLMLSLAFILISLQLHKSNLEGVKTIRDSLLNEQSLFLRVPGSNEKFLICKILQKLNQGASSLNNTLQSANLTSVCVSGFSAQQQMIIDCVELQVLLVDGFGRHQGFTKENRKLLPQAYFLLIISTVVEFISKRHPPELLTKALQEYFNCFEKLFASDKENSFLNSDWFHAIGCSCYWSFNQNQHVEYWERVARLLLRPSLMGKIPEVSGSICRQLAKGIRVLFNNGEDRQLIHIKTITLQILRQSIALLEAGVETHKTVEAFVKSQSCILTCNNLYQKNELIEATTLIKRFFENTSDEQTLQLLSYYFSEELLRLVHYRLYNLIRAECIKQAPLEVAKSAAKQKQNKSVSLLSFMHLYDSYYQCYKARHRLTPEPQSRMCFMHFYELSAAIVQELRRYCGMISNRNLKSELLKQLTETIDIIELSRVYCDREPSLVFFHRYQEDIQRAPRKYSVLEVVQVHTRLIELLLTNRPPKDDAKSKEPPSAQLFSIVFQDKKEVEKTYDHNSLLEQMCLRSQRTLPLFEQLLDVLSKKSVTRTAFITGLSFRTFEEIKSANSFEVALLLRNLEQLATAASSQGAVQAFQSLLSYYLSILVMFEGDDAFNGFSQPIKLRVLHTLIKYSKRHPELREFVLVKTKHLLRQPASKEDSDPLRLLAMRCGLVDSLPTKRAPGENNQLLLLNCHHLSVPLERSLIDLLSSRVYRSLGGGLYDLALGSATPHLNFFMGPLQSEHIRLDKDLLRTSVTKQSLGELVSLSYNSLEESYRVLPTLLVESLENMHKHGQISQVQAFEHYALAYLCRTNELALTTRLLRLFVGKQELVDFSRLYDGMKGIIGKVYSLPTNDNVREVLFNKRKSMSAKYTLDRLYRNLQKLTEGVSVRRCSIVQHFVELMLRHYSSQHEEPSFQCQMLVRRLRFQQSSLEALVKNYCKEDIPLDLQLTTLKQLLEKVLNCINDYEKALMYFQAYAEIDSLVTKQLCEASQEVLSRSEVRQYCEARSMNYLQLALFLMDYNYDFKRLMFSTPKLENIEAGVDKYLEMVTALQQNFESRQSVNDKIKSLLTGLNNTLCVLLPFGDRLLNIAVHNKTITHSSVPLNAFMDAYEVFDRLVKRNEIEMRSSKNPSNWWRNRQRINREVGKIVSKAEVGVFPRNAKANRSFSTLENQILTQYGCEIRHIILYARAIHSTNEKTFRAALIEQMQFKAPYFKMSRSQQEQLLALLVTERHANHNESASPVLLYSWIDISQFPFECSTVGQESVSMYRVPSASYILERNCSARSVNVNDLSYLINPGLDLKNTVSSFQRIREPFTQWNGILNKAPTHQEFLELLQRQAFLYMGHGSGGQYLPEPLIFQREVRSASLLFGCSSAKMQHKGSEAYGVAHTYLLANCPVVLGCLWDVTDVDTDNCTDRIFKAVKKGRMDLSSIVQKEKRECKMEYLNGSAMVVYGMPCTFYRE